MSEQSSHAESSRRRTGGPTTQGQRLASTMDAVVNMARDSNVQAEVTIDMDDGWVYAFRATPPGWREDDPPLGLADAEDATT